MNDKQLMKEYIKRLNKRYENSPITCGLENIPLVTKKDIISLIPQ